MIQKVVRGSEQDVFEIYRQCKARLDEMGIYQWLPGYPTLQNAIEDIDTGTLYGYVGNSNTYEGVITLSEEQAEAYKNVIWADTEGKVLVVHRLAVQPDNWKKGIARLLMGFAETVAQKGQYSSIRLDAFSENPRSLKLYESLGYTLRGEIFFEGRKSHFYCFEKLM